LRRVDPKMLRQQVADAYGKTIRPAPFVRSLLAQGLGQYTMLAPHCLRSLAWQVDAVQRAEVPGAFVECGVWRGGASFLMARRAALRGPARTTWMFDSFAGLPDPERIDGPAALRYSLDVNSPTYFDNCRAELSACREGARKFHVESNVEMVEGWFDETLPEMRAGLGPIALLRIDCDWYQSVKVCLEQLADQVSIGGFIVIDDYYIWDGCAIAVHEFLASRKLPYRIAKAGGCAYVHVTRS
jgi:O-methyltransferase